MKNEQNKCNDKNDQELCLDIVKGHPIQGRDAHDLPARISNGLYSDDPLFSAKYSLIIPIPQPGCLQVVFLGQT